MPVYVLMVWNAGCVLPCAGRLAWDCCVKLEAIKMAEIDSSARASPICSADAWIELFCFFFIGGAPQSRDEEERRPCYLELRERLRNSEALFYTCFQAVFRVEPPLLTEARKRRQYFFWKILDTRLRSPRRPTAGQANFSRLAQSSLRSPYGGVGGFGTGE